MSISIIFCVINYVVIYIVKLNIKCYEILVTLVSFVIIQGYLRKIEGTWIGQIVVGFSDGFLPTFLA